MKRILLAVIVLLYTTTSSAQHHSLCTLNGIPFESSQVLDDSLSFKTSTEARIFISELMQAVKLPMNFRVYQCSGGSCARPNNAFAARDTIGNQWIVYDANWFNNIEVDSLMPKSLTILSHEIGHHLAAHTLGIADKNHKTSINVCHKDSPSFDSTKCTSELKSDYLIYLSKKRENELQADRFSGYITAAYGLDSSDVVSWLEDIPHPLIEVESTHPSKSKRRTAIMDGFKLALSDKTKGKISELKDIKGGTINFVISNYNRIERNKILRRVRHYLGTAPIAHIDNSDDKLSILASSWAKRTPQVTKQMEMYLGRNLSNFTGEIDEDNEYFITYPESITLHHDYNVKFCAYPSVHIKDGYMNIVTFSETEYQRVIRVPFSESSIDFQEIETHFIAILKDGLQKAIFQRENSK